MLSKVSVIIPTLNSWVTLRYSIASLYKQTLTPFEIIVVDNDSSDRTSENVKKEFPEIKLVVLERNTGVTGGRNAGIKTANKNSQYLLFFDHDMVAGKSMLENLIKAINMNSGYGIATPKIGYLHSKGYIWSSGTSINLWTGQVLFRSGKDLGQYDKVEEVQVAPAAFLVKKEVIKKIGIFDNRYFATYEDTDFCFRAKLQGFSTVYTPYALAYHDISPDPEFTASRLLSRAYYVGRNRVLFMKDYAKSFPLFLLFSPVYLLYFVYLGLKLRNMKGVIDYLKGFMVGLKDCMKKKK